MRSEPQVASRSTAKLRHRAMLSFSLVSFIWSGIYAASLYGYTIPDQINETRLRDNRILKAEALVLVTEPQS